PRYSADTASEIHSHPFSCISLSSMVQQNYIDGHRLYHLLDMSGKEFVIMLMRTDPFREFDRLTQRALGRIGTRTRPTARPMAAWPTSDTLHMEFDLPGVDTSSIDLDVARNIVTITAQRQLLADDAEMLANERPRGTFNRQLVLGDILDTERISATYDSG